MYQIALCDDEQAEGLKTQEMLSSYMKSLKAAYYLLYEG